MIEDFRTLPDNVELEADLCIVGAGPAGLALAREFIGSSMRVMLVESGGMEPDAAIDGLNAGEYTGLKSDGLTAGRTRALGGATKLWAGQCMPLDAIDFEARSWIPHSGWPIAKTDLDPFYARAEAMMEVSGQPYDAKVWRSFGIAPLVLDDTVLGCKCSVYTPRLDFGSVSHAALRDADNIRVVLHATAGRLSLDEQSAARHLDVSTVAGRRGRITARAFVLCGGGIENARLLLLSDHQQRAGLGNDGGLVGRFFQEHPSAFTGTVHTELPRQLQDRYSLLYRGRHRFFPKISLSPARQRSERLLNGVANLVYEFDDEGLNAVRTLYRSARAGRVPPNAGGLVLDAARNVGTVFSLARRRLRGRSTDARPARIRLLTQTEQAPVPESRVTLADREDALGHRQANVEWRLSELERRTTEAIARAVRAEFARLSLGEVRVHDWVAGDRWTEHVSEAYHHIGTTRMASSPREGVVDRDCQVFGIRGLYVAGSSVFPTSGYANPTLTIVALALRLADHLKSAALHSGSS